MKISVLVPVYNVESYLQRCIDSVFAQDFKNYELILVDDGSTDNSGEICDANLNDNPNVNLKANGGKIKVIHKENGGLPSARLAGFREAKGEYVVFLDSDDWLLPGALRLLYEEISRGYDIVKSRPCRGNGTATWLESYPINVGELTGNVPYAEKMNYNQIHPYLHSGIYRRELFSEDVFQSIVDAGISLGEDWFANMLIAPQVNKVLMIDLPTQVYFVNSGSIVGTSILSDDINRKAEFALWCKLKEWNTQVYEMALSKQYIGIIQKFFVPEVPFRKCDYKTAVDYLRQNPCICQYIDAKYLRLIDVYPLYFVYVHTYRFLFKWIRLKGKSRKQV